MPFANDDNYRPPPWLLNGHFETIFPALFRRVNPLTKPSVKSIHTPDNDFFELAHYDIGAKRTVIISHGLEGDYSRPYMTGMANAFLKNGWNASAWSYRGCSGKVNNSIRSYHSGFTEDLKLVVDHALHGGADQVALVGFSLGGNMTLRYLSEKYVPEEICASAVFSVPLQLHDACLEISKKHNMIYSKRFLRSLKRKIRDKSKVMHEVSAVHLSKTHDLLTFDDFYTAPMHGFNDALHYYQSCSALYILHKINRPTLIVNALNDPFLPESCYPSDIAKRSPNIYLETPQRGGHVGFVTAKRGVYWSEKRAVEFVNSKCHV